MGGQELPASLAGPAHITALVAAGDAVALTGDSPKRAVCASWNSECWIEQASWASHVLVSRDRLLLGEPTANGVAPCGASRPDGSMREVGPNDRAPVTGLARLSGSRVLVGTRLAHMSLGEALAGVLSPADSWQTLV